MNPVTIVARYHIKQLTLDHNFYIFMVASCKAFQLHLAAYIWSNCATEMDVAFDVGSFFHEIFSHVLRWFQ